MAIHDDLDKLATELETLRHEAPADASHLEGWLRLVAERGASDLLLVAGEPPMLRIDGRMVRIDGAPLDGVDVEEMVVVELPPHAQRAYRDVGIADASRKVQGVGRFRINLHRERGRAAAAIRMLPRKVPSLASLDLPPGTELLSRLPRGLVLIGGATGSGKTTTLAALVEEINRRDAKHIITIEDPIEYEHTNQKSVVQQVEIGIDAPDFPTALAIRASPGAGRHRRRRDARSGDDAHRAGRRRDRPSGVLDAAHDRRAVDARAHDRLVSGRATAHDPAGDCRGAVSRLRAAAAAAKRRRPRAGRRAAHGQLRRPPAHPAQHAAAPASGDHDHAQARIVLARGVSGAPGQSRGHRPRRRRGCAPITPKTSSTP